MDDPISMKLTQITYYMGHPLKFVFRQNPRIFNYAAPFWLVDGFQMISLEGTIWFRWNLPRLLIISVLRSSSIVDKIPAYLIRLLHSDWLMVSRWYLLKGLTNFDETCPGYLLYGYSAQVRLLVKSRIFIYAAAFWLFEDFQTISLQWMVEFDESYWT